MTTNSWKTTKFRIKLNTWWRVRNFFRGSRRIVQVAPVAEIGSIVGIFGPERFNPDGEVHHTLPVVAWATVEVKAWALDRPRIVIEPMFADWGESLHLGHPGWADTRLLSLRAGEDRQYDMKDADTRQFVECVIAPMLEEEGADVYAAE